MFEELVLVTEGVLEVVVEEGGLPKVGSDAVESMRGEHDAVTNTVARQTTHPFDFKDISEAARVALNRDDYGTYELRPNLTQDQTRRVR